MYTTWSRKSEASVTSSSMSLNRLFDFAVNSVPGVFQTTEKHFILDYKGDLGTAKLKIRTNSVMFYSDLSESTIKQCGNEYSAHIKITHHTGEQFVILIPDIRSYNPGGLYKPYLTHSQYYYILKLIAAEVKAACMGASEEKLAYIKNGIESASTIGQDISEICTWVHIQVKFACFKKIPSPKFYEVLIEKVKTGKLELEGKDHCKEYLESCISGEEVVLPIFYYAAVLDGDLKIPFQVKNSYAEIISKEKMKKRYGILRNLPNSLPGLIKVKQGKSYQKLINSVNHYCEEKKKADLDLKCSVM